MTTTLLTVNAILFTYAIWAMASPKTALFFIPNKANRKRWPGSFIILAVWIVFGVFVGQMDDAQTGTESTEAQTEIATESESAQPEVDYSEYDSDPTELTPEILAAYDSIHKAGIEVYEIEGAKYNPKVGPNNETWRSIQWNNATLNATNLRLAENDINFHARLNEIPLSKWNKLEADINEAMSGSKDYHFGGYYTIGAIATLTKANHDKAVELKEKLSALKSCITSNQ